MSRHLSLIPGEAWSAPQFAPPAVVLNERTQRPGELADVVPIELSGDLANRVNALAQRQGMPPALCVVIAVEAARALHEVATATGAAASEVADWLDVAAAIAPPAEFEPPAARPLRAYARALETARYKSRSVRRLELIVPDRLRARWSLAAQNAGLTVEVWITVQLAAARPGTERWEAQAAAEARTLAEWVAFQALSRRRRVSASAHASAAG
jgi:hypothetical protein